MKPSPLEFFMVATYPPVFEAVRYGEIRRDTAGYS